jgi:hypothetical protein
MRRETRNGKKGGTSEKPDPLFPNLSLFLGAFGDLGGSFFL